MTVVFYSDTVWVSGVSLYTTTALWDRARYVVGREPGTVGTRLATAVASLRLRKKKYRSPHVFPVTDVAVVTSDASERVDR